jgi:hypothetical protein
MEVSGQLHAPAALPPGERVAVTHWIRRLGGPHRRTGCCWEEKSLPCRESNRNSSAPQPVARRYTHWVIPAPSKWKFPHTLITRGDAIYVIWINTGTFTASSVYLRTLPRNYFLHYTDSPMWRNKDWLCLSRTILENLKVETWNKSLNSSSL